MKQLLHPRFLGEGESPAMDDITYLFSRNVLILVRYLFQNASSYFFSNTGLSEFILTTVFHINIPNFYMTVNVKLSSCKGSFQVHHLFSLWLGDHYQIKNSESPPIQQEDENNFFLTFKSFIQLDRPLF